MNTTTHRNRKSTAAGASLPVSLAAGLVGAAVLALSMNGTVSALTAKITNDSNTAGVSGLTMKEFGYVGAVENSAADCDTASQLSNVVASCSFNKYGGDMGMIPGATKTVNVRIQNSSSTTAGMFTAKFDPCATLKKSDNTAAAASMCGKMKVTLKAQQLDASNNPTGALTTVFSNQSAAQLATTGTYVLAGAGGVVNTTGLPGGHSVKFTFEVTADTTIDTTNFNTYIKQPITWEFTA